MTDYSEHLLAARDALRRAEEAANRRDYPAMRNAALEASQAAIAVSQWANWAPEGNPWERKAK
jgi:hypothetical protein